jgi:hypothetical protein
VSNPYRPIRLTLWSLLGFAVVFGGVGLVGWGPAAENEQAIGEVSRWCERVSSGPLREPVNTLGNLAFIVAGLAMLTTLARDETSGRQPRNRFIGNTPVALLYAGAAVFLGPGSMVMHGSHTFFGAWIDNLSMVTYILIPWLVNVAVLGRWRDRRFFRVYGSVLAAYAAGYWFFGSDLGIGMDLFGLSIALWMISEAVYRWWSPPMRWFSGLIGFVVAAIFGITPNEIVGAPGDYWWVFMFWLPGLVAVGPADGRRTYSPWFWAGVASFVTAYAIWLTGTNDHSLCEPDSLIQAHAIWHILSALATWCFFKFLRTERPARKPTEVAEYT